MSNQVADQMRIYAQQIRVTGNQIADKADNIESMVAWLGENNAPKVVWDTIFSLSGMIFIPASVDDDLDG